MAAPLRRSRYLILSGLVMDTGFSIEKKHALRIRVRRRA